MAELFKVNAPVRKPLFEGVQGENEARSIQFDITPWVDELGDGAVTATAKRPQDSQPYPVTVTKDGTTVTWKPTSTDTAFAGVGSFQLEYTVDSVLAKTCIWSTMVAPSLDPAGDPPDPYDNWLAEMRQIAADALQSEQNADTSAKTSEAWAVGQRGGVDVPSTDPAYENNSKYWAEQSLANQYGAFIVKSASGDIASFSDGADGVPMKSVKVAIVPKQSGSGDPSPSNVRPITGTSTAEAYVRGVNLWDEEWELGSINITTGQNESSTTRFRSKNYIPIPEGKNFYSTDPTGNADIRFCYYDINKNFLGAGGWSAAGVRTPITGTRYVRFFCGAAAGTTYQNNISINIPTTDHEYHPYVGHTTPVPLGQTVYGGEVDVVSGEGEDGMAKVNLADITLTKYSTYSAGARFISAFFDHITNTQAVGGAILTNVFPVVSGNYPTDGKSYLHVASGSTRTSLLIAQSDVGEGVELNVENVKAWLASIGAYAVYKKATPTPFTTTPTEVRTLLGTNNVWSDAGAVEVEYRADPTLAYNELANVIVSLGGNL